NRTVAAPWRCDEGAAHVPGALAARKGRLRTTIDALAKRRGIAMNAQSTRQGPSEELGLVVAALPELRAVHRHGNDRIEIEVAAIPDHKLEQLGKRIVEEIVALEFECVKQPLERSAIVAPGIAPLDRQRGIHAADAASRFRNRHGARIAFWTANRRQRRPAGGAAGR